jgi:pyruvate/2-oxoglutarate dehydrogenase complex dihydrolipoamide acyltransferase (E2) component
MSVDIALPDTAWEGVEDGVAALLDQWLVSAGDAVRAGQPVAKVVLVKAALEVAAPGNGRVEAIHVVAGENFVRGQAIASLKEDA